MAGIGSEILASRLGVGPMGNPDAVELKYEEFFLSSWSVGDPAMVVDVPANTRNQAVTNPDLGSKPRNSCCSRGRGREQRPYHVIAGNGLVPQKLPTPSRRRRDVQQGRLDAPYWTRASGSSSIRSPR